MLADVESESNLFGISYFEPNESFIDKPEIGSIGCMAEVRESQQVENERSNILTAGIIRYRLLDYVDLGKPYLTAEVEFFEDVDEDEALLQPAADEIFLLFGRIAKAAFDLSGNRGRFPEIQKSDPERLSFVVTAAFSLDNALKYALLETNSTVERFEKLRMILEPAVGAMEESAGINKSARTNGHSKKKIDI